MAELDYAFLADFARVEAQGTLTAVGASWTFLQVNNFPAMHHLFVAGRIRAKAGEGDIPVRLEATGANEAFGISASGIVAEMPNARPYGDGFVGILFAVDLHMPLPQPGLVSVRFYIGDQLARRLAFDVLPADG